MSARDNILNRVRSALGRSRPPSEASSAAMRTRLREHPRGPLPSMDWEPVARFKERCLALSSSVDQIATLAEVPAALARYLAQQELPRDGVCWPELGALDWRSAGLAIAPRPATGDDKLGITGSYCAIAETGTLMLLSGAGTPATVSLLPETHVAIVAASRIVAGMEDAWSLARRELAELPRAVNFVSGPSRTGDIEQTIVLGAHGPYRVHVIVVEAA
jgi:L-lactate dehydrogenase complex protein LldG